jgi:hypothetical protein
VKALTPMASPARAFSVRVKPWNAVNMQDLHRFLLKSITKPFAAKKADVDRYHAHHAPDPFATGHFRITFQRLGPALNSGTSIFMYGPPGNGKTSIARAFGNLVLSQNMYIPYALYLDGQVIKVYDAVSHSLAPDNETPRQSQLVVCAPTPAAIRVG